MLVKSQNNEKSWAKPGDRFIQILDSIGFPKGYGRMVRLQETLLKYSPETFASLSYSTVKTWFSDRAPSMSRIDDVFEALSNEYTFPNDTRPLKSWWKVGGVFPFDNEGHASPRAISAKLEITLSVLISREMGEEFNEASVEEIQGIKNEFLRILANFADPSQVEPDEKTLAIILRGILKSK